MQTLNRMKAQKCKTIRAAFRYNSVSQLLGNPFANVFTNELWSECLSVKPATLVNVKIESLKSAHALHASILSTYLSET